MSPSEMRSMQNMFEAMTNGEPEVKKQMEGYWKMLDSMAENNPDEYNKYISE